MQQVFHLSPQPLATATAWRFVLCCCMIALFTHAAMADSPCDIVQVFPVHEVGLGAAEDIRLSLSSMPTGMSYYLDGKLCTASDTFTLKCSVQPLDDDEGLFALLASNGSMPFTLTSAYFGATSWCYLNHTADGTLLRQAYLTPIVLSTKVVTPFLPQPIMHLRWAASSALFSITNNTTVTTVPVIYVSNGAVLQLSSVSAVGTAQFGFSIYSSVATFPTFLDGAHHALWNITLRIQTGRGRWVGGVVASAAKYAKTLVEYEKDWSVVVNSFDHSRGNVSGNDGLTWTQAFGAVVPVIFNVSVSAASIVTPQVSSADASSSSFSPLVQVTIRGAFPACSTDLCRSADVTLTHLFHQTAVRCRITSINSSTILCFANLTVNQSNAAPLPLGLGFTSVIVNSTVPSVFEEVVVPINVASVAGGWLSLGPLTRAVIVMIPNDAANENGTIYGGSDNQRQHFVRVHCASSAAIEVRNSATGEVLCSVFNDSRIGANASRVIALEHANELSRIVLDSSCCSVTSSSGRCVTGSLCAVSLEHMNISSASQEQQHLVAVALIEVESAVEFTNHTIVSTSSRFLHRRIGEELAAPFVFLPIADGSIVLRVPAAIDNETQCKQSLISIAQGSQATVTSMWGRFSPNLNGTWRNGTLRCSWHVVFPVTSCAPFRTQGNASQGSTNSMEAAIQFCGPRRAFEDPIPYTRMEIPSDAPLQKVDVMASNTWVPRVVFPGFPPTSSTVLVATENGTTNKTSVASFTTDASQLQHVLAAVSPTQAVGGATVSILVGFNGSSSQVNVTGVGLTTSRISSDVDVLDAIIWMIISGKQACSQSGASSSAFGSWDVCTNITVIVPTGGAPSGFYRVVVLLDAGGTVTIPSDATILTQATSSMFFFVKATVTSVSSDTVGAVGGGTFTMQGRNFPLKGATGGQLSMSVFGDSANAFIPSVLLLGSDVFLSWTTGNLINITGPRTLNTVQGNWTMCVVVAVGNMTSFCAQTINGTIPIYQPAALPRITEVAPLTLSSASDFVLTVQGTSLSLREISVCPEAAVSSTVTTPYFLREVEACEWCVPSFSNATRVECVVSRAVRHGTYGVYLSSPTAGAAVSTGIVPLQFSFAITAVYPPDVSAFGSAALTITGVSLTSEWVYSLWEPILNQYVDCANVTMVGDTLILCSLPAFYSGGTSLSLREISVCPEAAVSSTVTTPYFLREVEACEWCVPSFSNATRVECVVSRAVRHGTYGVYLSSPTAGAAVSTGIVPLQFSFAITAVYPPDVSAFGSAALTITGVSLTSEWVYSLWEPILNQYVDCANVTMVGDTLILCSLPAFYSGAVSQGVPYELVAQHRVLGSTIQCATSATTTLGSSSSSSSFSTEGLPPFSSASCTVTFGADLLPTFVSV
ncbi:GPI-anchored surface protein, putative, partial [Bodo saltans]